MYTWSLNIARFIPENTTKPFGPYSEHWATVEFGPVQEEVAKERSRAVRSLMNLGADKFEFQLTRNNPISGKFFEF